MSYLQRIFKPPADNHVRDWREGVSYAQFSVNITGPGFTITTDTQEAVWQLPRGGRAIVVLGNSADSVIQTKLDMPTQIHRHWTSRRMRPCHHQSECVTGHWQRHYE